LKPKLAAGDLVDILPHGGPICKCRLRRPRRRCCHAYVTQSRDFCDPLE
jgi:hypothetical protein